MTHFMANREGGYWKRPSFLRNRFVCARGHDYFLITLNCIKIMLDDLLVRYTQFRGLSSTTFC